MRRNAIAVVLVGLCGCAEIGPAEDGTSRLALKTAALSACSGEAGDPFQEIGSVQIQVHPATPSPDPKTYDESFSLGGGRSVVADDVPEGPDEQVTVFGWTGGNRPGWFARKKHVVISKGASNPITMILSRFGGFSCPAPNNEYTHRIFPTVTPLGAGYFLIAGGLTHVDVTGGTKFQTNQASRKAFVYDSLRGTVQKVESMMQHERGAHAAVLVKGLEKNHVILFGGTQAMQYNPSYKNGFAWYFDTNDALSTVDVFEYEVGGDPTKGTFLAVDDHDPKQTMPVKRVLPSANVISTDGLVLVCGGGPWGEPDRPSEYMECDVWNTLENSFLVDENGVSLSNNNMLQYRATASVVSYQQGEITRLLFAGGVTEGPVFELYRSSTAQKDGGGGTFAFPQGGADGPPHSFFQSLTPMGDNRFMMLGGVNWNGQKFDGTNAGHAWIVKIVEKPEGTGLEVEQVAGLGVGRYFHAAASPAKDRFVVLGGFENNDLSAVSDIRHWQHGVGLVTPDGEAPFSARGGMASVLLDDDTILLVGGVNGVDDLKTDQAGAIEVYAPSNLFDREGGSR